MFENTDESRNKQYKMLETVKEINKDLIWKIRLIHLGWIIHSPTPHPDVQKW